MDFKELTFDALLSVKKDVDQQIERSALEYISDRSQPIAERLAFYKKHAGKAWVDHDGFLPHNLPTFDKLYANRLYDDFYFERHETVKFTTLIERIEEEPEKWGPVNEQFLEELFESGLTSFEFDW